MNSWYGLQPPQSLPPGTPTWGARAIFSVTSSKEPVRYKSGPKKGQLKLGEYRFALRYNVELLWDRQQFHGTDGKQLQDWINNKGLRLLKDQLHDNGISPSDDATVTVSDGCFNILASPKRSFGYLYIVAWQEK
jgi:hypothetical protein